MAASKKHLFTYGTLRKGEHNPMQEFLSNSAQWIGKAVFQGKLYYENGHPAAISSVNEEDKVLGDLFEFDAASDLLEKLDHYEGYRPNDIPESLYIRKKREVVIVESNKLCKAWIYIYNQPVERANLIESGDYVQFSRA
ncbi:MAG: gamma-glutamylcyclotransferase family protein [Candidatus Halalkalibacterium sp. M3_1C_030]